MQARRCGCSGSWQSACRAALQVVSDAQVAAAQLSVPLLREATAAAGGEVTAPLSREAEKRVYAAARVAGRWGEIQVAVQRSESALRDAETALVAAIGEAGEQVERLLERKAAAVRGGGR